MKKLVAGKPIKIRTYTIIPIEEIRFYNKNIKNNFFIYGSKNPKGIIVLSSGDQQAFDIHSNELQIDELMDKVEGLDLT